MSASAIDILVTDARQPASPLAGVVVKVLTQDGKRVVCQVTTGEDGVAQLLLTDGTYQARFFKFGVSFQGAVLIDACEESSYVVRGTPYVYPSSTDNRICIASGIFRTPTGGIARSVDIQFIAKWNPILLEGSPIMPERVSVRTDANGYVEVPLIRFGQYDATIEGMEDYQRQVSVPDAAAVNIGDLLFPVVSVVSFEGEGPYTSAVGTPLVLRAHVFSSDGNELPTVSSDVIWTTNNARCAVVPGLNTLTVNADKPGTYQIQATRRDASIIRIPDTQIQGVPVQITFT